MEGALPHSVVPQGTVPLTGEMEEVLPNAVVPQGTVALDTLSPAKLAGFSTKTNKSAGGTQTAALNRTFESQLEEIYMILAEGRESASCRALLDGSYPFTFQYKKRKCTGGAIHIAALQTDGELLEQLLDLQADINFECRYMTFEKEGRAQPIHLAVQGCLENVQLLINAGADVNARVKVDGADHFCPLHDAVFFRDVDMVQYLLEKGASVNALNLDRMTPLHVAAKMGASEVAELLVRNEADTELRDESNRSALEVAVESGVFPQRRLYLLAKFRIGDIMIVSEHCPSATTEFIRNLLCDYAGAESADQVAHKTNVADELQTEENLTVEHWIALLDNTPDAADYLLEILTVEPDEDSVYYHPLPNQAILKDLRADYNTDDSWKCDTETGDRAKAWPAWHDRLAPGARAVRKGRRMSHAPSNRLAHIVKLQNQRTNQQKYVDSRDLQPVHMRQLRLKGIVCPEVLQALSETKYVEIFRSPAVTAILTYCWDAFVLRWYLLQLLHRILELLVLSAWTYSKSQEFNGKQVPFWQRRISWTFMFESAVRDTYIEAFQAYGFCIQLQNPRSYFGNGGNYIDVAVISIFNVVVGRALYSGQFSLDEEEELFAVLVFVRWFQMLFALRAFKLGMIGVKGIIPILHSVKKIGGMGIICTFVFAGFWHAFMILDNGVEGPYKILVGTVKLLFMVDGDGIVQVLKLGNRGDSLGNGDYITLASLMIAVIIFCISLLNLFIAVHGRAYSEAHIHATNLFLQERAAICVHCMVQPKLPMCCNHDSGSTDSTGTGGTGRRMWQLGYLIVSVLAFGGWILCIVIEDCPAIIPALLLSLAFYLFNGLLLERPWMNEDICQRSYLWWCAPTSRQYGISGEAEQAQMVEDMAERLVRLEKSLEELRQTAHAQGRPQTRGGRPLGNTRLGKFQS
ncbi:ANKRD31 [Symbiodinium natans]|uniref:ANKRD31 protein n=1 Tax=Symbiodinium natans TaxID=878477 RepID=A0A812TD27_9DINO|nr:ANKRD31 [Symbiodinium natans]